jgi:hypothetical protein
MKKSVADKEFAMGSQGERKNMERPVCPRVSPAPAIPQGFAPAQADSRDQKSATVSTRRNARIELAALA